MKNIAIVGAGVSGMTAAIYCLKSGFNVTLYEKHSISGGLCTSWKRQGYTFEGGVHWLTDAYKNAPLYDLWRDTGILGDDVKTYREDPYMSFTFNGENIYLYRDLEKQKKHFLEISPEDSKAIEKFYSDVKAYIHFIVPIRDIKGVKTLHKRKITFKILYKMVPAILKMKRLMKLLTTEYAANFKHAGIRKVLSDCIVTPDFDSVSLISTIATLVNDGVFPEGGSLALVKRVENKINELGGKILFNTKVDKIIVENGEAKGVIVNGKKELFDSVIVTVDTAAAQNLFDIPLNDKWIQAIKAEKAMFCTFAGIGVHADLSNLPGTIGFSEKISVGGIDYDFCIVRNYSNKHGFAPEGCTSVTIMFAGNSYDFWKKHKQAGTYNKQKELLAAEITGILEKHFPQIKGKIDVINIATPLTYERYTGSWHGSWMGIKAKNDKFSMSEPICAEIKKVYFAGFRTINPGGLPIALYSGFRAAQYICKDNNVVFKG